MLRLVLSTVMLSCLFAARVGGTELEVVAFGATSVKLEHVYDRQTGTYLVPTSREASLFQPSSGMAGPEFPLAAVVDTGVLSHHPIIKDSLRESIDFTGEGPEDLLGHGTIVALIYLGTVPARAPIVSAKALNRRGVGKPENLIKAIEWAGNKGARVINVSAGVYLPCTTAREQGAGGAQNTDSCERTPICQAVTGAARAGALVVAAVGNKPGRIACPACCREALAVGASVGEAVAPYTGKLPDVLAPGTIYMRPLR